MLNKLNRYLSLPTFYRMARRLWPYCALISGLLMVLGLFQAFFIAPADYQQGDAFRIIYIHVPSAYLSLFIYFIMAVCALLILTFRLKIAYLIMDACIVPGLVFTFLALVTGSIWGKPMWGTWWIWDARLTSELILFLWYVLILSLKQALAHKNQGLAIRALIVLIGSINLPIVHYSVEWWQTLHQGPTLSRFAVPAMDKAMLYPLLIMLAAFTFYFFSVLLLEVMAKIQEQRKQTHDQPTP